VRYRIQRSGPDPGGTEHMAMNVKPLGDRGGEPDKD